MHVDVRVTWVNSLASFKGDRWVLFYELMDLDVFDGTHGFIHYLMDIKSVQLLSLLIAPSLASGNVFKLTPEFLCHDLRSLTLIPKTNVICKFYFNLTKKKKISRFNLVNIGPLEKKGNTDCKNPWSSSHSPPAQSMCFCGNPSSRQRDPGWLPMQTISSSRSEGKVTASHSAAAYLEKNSDLKAGSLSSAGNCH